MGTFEIIDHTADVGLRIEAESFEDLLETAARAVFSIMLVDAPNQAAVEHEVRVEAPPGTRDLEEILVSWLQELLYLFHTKRLVPLEFVFHERGPRALRARVGFGRFDPDRHRTGAEIKAVTYHGLQVCEVDHGWCGQVVLDI